MRKMVLALALMSAVSACGADTAGTAGTSDAGGFGTGGVGNGAGGDWGGSGGAGGADSASMADLPPEQEKEVDFGAPEGSPNFVYVPVKDADNIVKVDGKTLDVTLVEVGDRPTVVKAVPGKDVVLVISSGTDELGIVESAPGNDDVVTLVPILPHCNAIAVSPDGAWAMVWYDHGRAAKSDPVGSFQAVTLVPLATADHTPRTLSTGFRPRGVQFTADGKQALVVTDDGVSVVVLATAEDGAIVPPIAIDPNPLNKPAEREVKATPDGRWALVRQSELAGLFAVYLPSGTLVKIPMSSVPTDLDLSPDGTMALAVLRSSGEVALVPLPEQATPTLPYEAISVAPLVAGLASITSDGQTAILYSSVAGVESVAALDLPTRALKAVPLRKTVDYVWLAEGSRTAVLVHKPAKGPLYDADPTEAFVDDSQGYTLFDLDSGYTKLVLTEASPAGIAASAAPKKAWILLPDPKDQAHRAQAVDLKSLLVAELPLPSRPEYVRPLDAAGVVAVSQVHPTGRMTFFDAKDSTAKTVTGYELNGLVK